MTIEEIIEEYADELTERPWLRAFVEPDDESLDEAEARWADAVIAAKIQLRAKGIELRHCATTRDGLQTTMYHVIVEGGRRWR